MTTYLSDRIDQVNAHVQGNGYRGPVLKVFDQRLQSLIKSTALKLTGPEVHDVAANVPDDPVQVSNRPFQPWRHFPWLLRRLERDVLQGEPHGIYGLDDAVMEVPADAVPFFGYRQPPGLLSLLVIKLDVVDGDG